MATISIDAGKLGARMRSDASGAPRAVKQAMFSSAQRGRAWIVGKTPVDRGILKNAWRVLRMVDGVELVNDQPYAGIIERGSRPFKISKAGLEALAGWVKRKILDGGSGLLAGSKANRTKAVSWAAKRQQAENKAANKRMRRGEFGPKQDVSMRSLRQSVFARVDQLEKEAMRIAYAIAKKWEKLGRKGTRFIMRELPRMAMLMDLEINRFLTKFFNRAS